LDELHFENSAFNLIHLESDKKRLAELIESDIYVCEDNGIVGYCALFDTEIRAILVCPKARGNGIGGKLLNLLLSKAIGPITLNVVKSNTPAQQRYLNSGFKVTKEFQTNYNGTPVIANKMVRASL